MAPATDAAAASDASASVKPRWADLLERHGGSVDEESGPGNAASAVPAGEVLEVEDEGRDSVPDGEPRTHGQAALRRALAEGRVVRSLPPSGGSTSGDSTAGGATVGGPAGAATAADDQGAPSWGGPAPDEWSAVDAHSGPASPSSGPSPMSPSSPVGADSPASPLSPESPKSPDDSGSDGPPVDGQSAAQAPSAAARAAASWGTAGIAAAGDPAPQAAAASAAAPAPATASAAPSAPADQAPAPRSGAALVREAAMASRTANQQRGRVGRPGAQSEPEVDPTGGASRDDEDAEVTSRSGREVIESVLGGRVLEIIDETPQM